MFVFFDQISSLCDVNVSLSIVSRRKASSNGLDLQGAGARFHSGFSYGNYENDCCIICAGPNIFTGRGMYTMDNRYVTSLNLFLIALVQWRI